MPAPSRTLPPRLQSSGLMLALANTIPLFGALFLGWDIFTIMVLFWMENLVIGFYALLRIVCAGQGGPALLVMKVFTVPFFFVHYGMFTLVHGILVMALFGGGFRSFQGSLWARGPLGYVSEMPHLLVPVAAMMVSHGYSFVINYLRGGESKSTLPAVAMFQPYPRVVVLHLTILAGGFLAMVVGANWLALGVLVVLKMLVDLAAHVREHNPAKRRVRSGTVPGTRREAMERLAQALHQQAKASAPSERDQP